MKFWLCLLLSAMLAVPVSAAESLLVQARAKAARTMHVRTAAQPAADACQAAADQGTEDAQRRQGRGGWIAGGILLPVIIPIVAHVSSPQAPADTVVRFTAEEARCYEVSYRDAAGSRRRSGAWIGSGIGIAAFVALVVAAASDTGY